MRSLLLSLLALPALGLQLLPPPTTTTTVATSSAGAAGSWSPRGCRTIYLEAALAAHRDTDGLTLIPPSGADFARLFQADLEAATGARWALEVVASLPETTTVEGGGAVLLGNFTGDRSQMVYADGTATSEGYALDVGTHGVSILGTGARGMWWGTRTFLQMVLTSTPSYGEQHLVPATSITDAPAFRTRGYMFDAGRKYYSADFLKEMCSYASFFKMSEFHYHLSDNYPLSRGHNETWQDVYAHFSLLPEDPALLGIVHGRANESLTRAQFEDVQRHCAARGVTVIPEIEAPGHCLYLTKWKPELTLGSSHDLLNLSHPDTLPTVQAVWTEFLPWFQTKEVHIGADEYDATLAADYIGFVNAMAAFLQQAPHNKTTRIWGTYMDPTNVTIDPRVLVQHWQAGQDVPQDLVAQGHATVNSHDWWAYMSIKNDHTPIYPAPYPQFFNESRVLDFADVPGWQWTPADYNNVNATQQLAEADPHNRGAIVAAWNDNGPDASTQLEMYYALRRGIALVGARAWSGARGAKVDAAALDPSVDFFSPRAPGQNLDRVLKSPVVAWTRGWFARPSTVHLGHGSKGLNYTLHLDVDGPFALNSSDATLALAADGHLTVTADGIPYPLRSVTPTDALVLDPGLPGRIWVNTTSTHDEVVLPPKAQLTLSTDALHGTVVWANGELVGRFEVYVFGGHNTQLSWSQMAFVAPLETLTGGGVKSLRLEADAGVLEKY